MPFPLDDRAGDQFAEENGPIVRPLAEDDPLASFASEHDDAVETGMAAERVHQPVLAADYSPPPPAEADLLRSAPDAPSRLMLASPTGRLYRVAARTAVAAAVVALAAAGAYLYPATQVPLTGEIADPSPPRMDARTLPRNAPTVAAVPSTDADGGSAERSLLSGDWMMNTRVESSRLGRYEGLRLGYRVTLRQLGNRISGTGWKVSEDEQTIGAAARTPITFEGTLNDDRLELTFTEQGRRRVTAGKLVLARHSQNAMQGRFSSTAAQSSGVVEIYR